MLGWHFEQLYPDDLGNTALGREATVVWYKRIPMGPSQVELLATYYPGLMTGGFDGGITVATYSAAGSSGGTVAYMGHWHSAEEAEADLRSMEPTTIESAG